jgi:putative transposase
MRVTVGTPEAYATVFDTPVPGTARRLRQNCVEKQTLPLRHRRARHPEIAMPRPPRDFHAGGYYHVNTRGNNKARVYVDSTDRQVFLRMLERSQLKYEWIIYAWCLMTNHYHAVVRIPQNGLSQGMSELNGSFGRWSNLRHGRCDHVFGRRFSSREITTDAHLLEACRYVVLNPVRAGLCDHPADWRWSSYRACAGLEPPQPFLARDAMLDLVTGFFGKSRTSASAAYQEFVLAGLEYVEVAVPGTATQV